MGYKSQTSGLKIGDTLFLYNYDEGILHGTFEAISECKMDIIADAWNGRFPWQVRVKRISEHEPISRSQFETAIGFKKRFPQASLDNEQLLSVAKMFESTLRIPSHIKDYREDNPGNILTIDGHRVRSHAEKVIDNWLADNRIFHIYEPKIGNGFGDFLVPKNEVDYFIEYWGLNEERYEQRKKHKLNWYKEHQVQLIELTHKDLKRLDKMLKRLL